MSVSKASLLSEIREAVAKKQSETGERNAVVRVLAKHGAYSVPKIETGRFGKGATIRVYIWKTKWGSLVLSSGPSVEGEVQYADKRSVSDAPDGYYHMLEKATGTSKITSAMKKIAARQDVTGSTTVSKPKRKKAAPKRKAAPKKKAAPKEEIVFVAKTRGGKYRIEAEYDGDTYTIRRYTSGRQTGGNVGIRNMRDLQIELGKLVGGAAIDGINYKVESWGRTFDITEFEFVRDRTEGAFTQEVAIAEDLPSEWTEPEEIPMAETFEEEIEVMSTQDKIAAAIQAAVASIGVPEGDDVPF